jgi:hypothetical protein
LEEDLQPTVDEITEEAQRMKEIEGGLGLTKKP